MRVHVLDCVRDFYLCCTIVRQYDFSLGKVYNVKWIRTECEYSHTDDI